jgi:hypothetical protein
LPARSPADSVPLTRPWAAVKGGVSVPLLLGLAAAIALMAVALAGASASANVIVNATISPLIPTEGQLVTINYTIVNLDNTTEQSLVVNFQTGNTIVGSGRGIPLGPAGAANGTVTGTVTFVATIPNPLDAGKGLTVQVQRAGSGTVLGSQPYGLYRVIPKPPVVTTFPIVPVAGAVIAVVGVLLFLILRKRKQEEVARLAAEAAAKTEVERRVAAETARELAVTQKVHGKYPAEYFQRRRTRLAVLIPIGLTSAGLTVLQRKKFEEKKIIYSCPRCGTHKEAFDAPCPRCSVQDAVEVLRGEVKKHRTGADFTDVSNLLQQAEFQLSYSSFGEADALVSQARTAFQEILAGGERSVVVKRMETISAAQSKSTVQDLGLMTKHTTVDVVAEEQQHEGREDYARDSQHCPTCGHAMYGDLCAFCNFDDYAKLVEDAIAQGAKAGAETVEPRDLLERARKMREEDNKSIASRYLNRARFLAGKHLTDHLAAKAEGMIDYARTLMLVGDEDGFYADFGDVEATLARADEKKNSGEAAAAVALAAKAEDQINDALHALSKRVAIKRMDDAAKDIDDARGKGTNVKAPEAKLKEARAAFDEGEFERARDLAADVKKSLTAAAKGKEVCPKCGKPTQPTWARCPFCTTPLK